MPRPSAITTDHESYFASWSGNRIVVSKLATGAARPHNFVIDPSTGEVRSVSGPQLWLPTVNPAAHARPWAGSASSTRAAQLPAPRAGALYLMDWSRVDPFGAERRAAGRSTTAQRSARGHGPADTSTRHE